MASKTVPCHSFLWIRKAQASKVGAIELQWTSWCGACGLSKRPRWREARREGRRDGCAAGFFEQVPSSCSGGIMCSLKKQAQCLTATQSAQCIAPRTATEVAWYIPRLHMLLLLSSLMGDPLSAPTHCGYFKHEEGEGHRP